MSAMGADNHVTVVPENFDGDNDSTAPKDIHGVENPYGDLDDAAVRRQFASAYSEAYVLDRAGTSLQANIHLLHQELVDRGLDAQRALDLHDVPNFVCPECDTVGVHKHATEGVRACHECGHVAGEASFIP